MVRPWFKSAALVAALFSFASAAAHGQIQTPPVQHGGAHVASMQTLATERRGRAIQARDLIELVRISGSRDALIVSPDGRFLLFQLAKPSIAENRVALSWALLDLAAPQAPPRLLGAGDPIPDILDDGRRTGSALDPRAQFSPDGASLAFVFGRGGRQDLHVAAVADLNAQTIVAASDAIEDISWLGANTVSFTTLRAAPAPPNEADQGYLYDGRFAPSVSMAPQRASIDLPSSHHYRWSARAGVREIQDAPRADARAGDDQRVLSEGLRGARAWAEPVSHDAAGAYAPLRPVVSLAGAGDRICSAPACMGAIEHLFWSVDGARLFLLMRQASDPARRKIVVWSFSDNSARDIFATDAMLLGCKDTILGIACVEEAPHQPRRIVLINERTASIMPIFDPNPNISALWFGRVDRLHAVDDFGNQSFAHLVYPRGFIRGRRYPLVIVQYRWRGFLNGGVGGEYPIYRFAERGMLVLEIDRPEDRQRGAELSSDQLQALYTRGAYARAMTHSALGAYVECLVAQGLADPDRIGLTGLSDGADTVFYALMHSAHARAAIVSTPPSDPYDYYLSSDFNRAALQRLGVGDPFSSDNPFWRAVAPFFSSETLTTPMLMNLADDEAVRGMPFLTRMRDRNRPIEAYVFEGEHHIKTGPRHLLAIHERNLAWMDFWLRGREDGLDPIIRARWRALRADQARALSGAESAEAGSAAARSSPSAQRLR